MKKKLLSILLVIICLFMTTGCFEEEQHIAQGSMWYVETEDPTDSYEANVGDMYLNATTNDLWQLSNDGWNMVGNIQGESQEQLTPTIEISDDGYWVINGVKTENRAVAKDGKDGKDGVDGEDGKDGQNGTNGIDGENGKDGETPSIVIGANGNWYIDGKDTGINSIGKDGENGQNGTDGKDGVDGTSVYVGYDGYIWSGSTRTDYKVENATKGENIVESTIGIEGTMSLYFENGYLDLKNNTVALMSNYMPTAKLTLYSTAEVKEIKVYTKEAGKLSIGTAKVTDIVNARTTGSNYTANTTEYEVTKGLNTITLNIQVAEDETIILGGNNSVGIFYATGIDIDDEQGTFTLVDGSKHNYIISSTNNVKDKLAIEVKADLAGNGTPVFPTVLTDFPNSSIASGQEYQYQAGNPYTYTVTSYFEDKHLTKIGVPVKRVSALDENQFFTLYILDKTYIDNNKASTALATYKIYLPKEELGTSTTINKWIHVDVSDLNIYVGKGQTLGFTSNTDNVVVGYNQSLSNPIYSFRAGALNTLGQASPSSIFWDIYYKSSNDFEKHIESLEEKEEEAKEAAKLLELQSVIGGKNISFLGDSITTFQGYSNDATNTNSTIGSNAIYYTGSNYVTNVNDTWWKQTANNAGLNVLVDNAWSGDRVTSRGQTRNTQLHDDTGENAGTNPDIIVVYLGINDYDGGVAVSTFETSYDTMIKNMMEKYTEADVFLLNFVPNNANSRATSDMEAYNKVVADTATKYGATLVDIYKESGITASNKCTYMGDSSCLHPNVAGMTAMANVVTKTMYNKYVATTTEQTTVTENVTVSVVNATPIATDITQTATLATNPEDIENPNTSTNMLKILVMCLIVITLFIAFKASSTIQLTRYNN